MLINTKMRRFIVIGVVMLLALTMIACSKAEPETLSEILDRAANVTLVKYEVPFGSSWTKVWVKGSKWRIELPPQVPPPVTPNIPGGIVSSRVAQGYFVDTEAKTVSIWYTPGNVVEEAIYDTAGNVVDFVSAMKWANLVATSNPKLVGTETVDGKSSLVVEFARDPWTGKAWIWKEKPFLLRIEMARAERKIINAEFRNIEFSDIPDSIFERP